MQRTRCALPGAAARGGTARPGAAGRAARRAGRADGSGGRVEWWMSQPGCQASEPSRPAHGAMHDQAHPCRVAGMCTPARPHGERLFDRLPGLPTNNWPLAQSRSHHAYLHDCLLQRMVQAHAVHVVSGAHCGQGRQQRAEGIRAHRYCWDLEVSTATWAAGIAAAAAAGRAGTAIRCCAAAGPPAHLAAARRLEQ